MARFSGVIGYISYQEVRPGDFENVITEKRYKGDVITNRNRLEVGDYLKDDLKLDNIITIVADAYAKENFHHIRYVVYMGVKWKVRTAEIQYPRLRLVLGDMFNG